ncbi:MAG: AAA family ATPase [Promethearchaeota archaeon]
MDSNQFCLIFCGLPASGKTTLANALKEIFESSHYLNRLEIVDIDQIRDHLYGTSGIDGCFISDLESKVRRLKKEKIIDLLESGASVIDDDLNYFRSMRREIVEICARLNVYYGIIYFNTPVQICLDNNEKRGSVLPARIIHTVNERFDMPGSRHYRWDEPFYMIDFRSGDIKDIAADIVKTTLELMRFLNDEKRSLEVSVPRHNASHSMNYWNLALIRRDFFSKTAGPRKAKQLLRCASRVPSSPNLILERYEIEARRVISNYVKNGLKLNNVRARKIKIFRKAALKDLRQGKSSIEKKIGELKKYLSTLLEGNN